MKAIQKIVPKRKGLLQFRKVDDSDKRWYSPNRDLTVVFPRILRETFIVLETFFDDLSAPRPDVVEIVDKLGISSEEVGKLAQCYGRLIKAIRERKDLSEELFNFRVMNARPKALIGYVFLDLLTREFAIKYYQTLHPKEPDPNDPELKSLQMQLESKRSWWKKLWRRISLAVRFLITKNYAGNY